MQNLIAEIKKFDTQIGIASADTPPASWYIGKEFLELDERVLKKNWQFAASVDQFPEVGSYVAGTFCGEAYFIMKGENQELKAFYNVCKHHAAELLSGAGCAREIVCPYHAWSYSADGKLKKAPHMAGVKNFDREKLALQEIPLKTWGKFVVLYFGEEKTLPVLDFQGFKNLLSDGATDELQFRGRRVYEIQCNWKVYIDNYLDGGYHVDHLHKGLAGQLNLDEYKVENYDRWTLQWCAAAKNPAGSQTIDFKERIGERALYAWFFPNFMINRYGPIMDTNWIVPVGHNKCLTIFDYYFKPEATDEFVNASIKASEQVQIEDVAICESVQRGLHSRGYNTGRYSPKLETGEYLFHSWMKEEYEKDLLS